MANCAGRQGRGREREKRGECSPAAKWREIVGRNGSGRRFEPFANQIAIIDGNNHTVETSLSPGLVFFPWRSPFALFRSIIGSNVNNILFCQYYLPYTSPPPLPSPFLPLLIHLSIYVHFHNPARFFSFHPGLSRLYPLQRRLSLQFCSKFERWVNNDHPLHAGHWSRGVQHQRDDIPYFFLWIISRGEYYIILFSVSFIPDSCNFPEAECQTCRMGGRRRNREEKEWDVEYNFFVWCFVLLEKIRLKKNFLSTN